MNKSRIDFKKNNDFKITPYWLPGFVEGEGYFFVSKGKNFQYKLGFNLTQSIVDLPLMEAIRKFFVDLRPPYAPPFFSYCSFLKINLLF
jgi:hypothetical protein